MGDYDGPTRFERSEDAVVEFTGHGPGGNFTVYLEPGESLRLADDGPNAVEVEALKEADDE